MGCGEVGGLGCSLGERKRERMSLLGMSLVSPIVHFEIGAVTGAAATLTLPTAHFWIGTVTGVALALPTAHF